MDSVVALHWARAHHTVVSVLSFDYASKHNHREIPFAVEHAQQVGAPHQTVPLDFIGKHFTSDLLVSGGDIPEGHYEDGNMKRTVVPFRNGIMLAAACGFAESARAEGLAGATVFRGIYGLDITGNLLETSAWSLVEHVPVVNEANRPRAYVHSVTPGYFDTLGIRLVEGRDFASADLRPDAAVVVVMVAGGLGHRQTALIWYAFMAACSASALARASIRD